MDGWMGRRASHRISINGIPEFSFVRDPSRMEKSKLHQWLNGTRCKNGGLVNKRYSYDHVDSFPSRSNSLTTQHAVPA